MTLDFRPKKTNVSSESSPTGRRPLDWLDGPPINPTFYETLLLSVTSDNGLHASIS
jgi:hypothetical protein